MKKLLSAFLVITMLLTVFVMPSVNAEDEGTPVVNPYEVLYNLNYENIASASTSTWDYACALEGSRTFCVDDGFSGTKSMKMSTVSGYASFLPYHGWDGKTAEISLTEGNTYVMSFKVKNISESKTAKYNSLRDISSRTYIWGLNEPMGLWSNGWKTVSHTFTVGESVSSTGDVLTGLPAFVYKSGVDEAIVLIDDFRLVQINDTSILNDSTPVAEITSLSPTEMTVEFSQEMSDDVLNKKAYTINGVEVQSVTYDAETKTATVVPAEELEYGKALNIAISGCDYLGRAVHNTTEMTLEKEIILPQMVSSTLPENGSEENVGRNTYSVTFDKDMASAEVKVNGVSADAIKVNGKTVSFEALLDRTGEKAVVVNAVDTEGGTITVTRTFNIKDNWVAFTDFENKYNLENFATKASGFMGIYGEAGKAVELTGEQTHSGSYSLHTVAEVDTNVSLITGQNYGWAYAKAGSGFAGLEIGKSYKYSYWVYADEAATATTPNLLLAKAAGDYYWEINKSNYADLPKQQWNYFEAIFTAEKTDLPFFYKIPANLYIDDIRLEEIPTAEVVSTTLPEDGASVELGYNEYSVTLSKEIASATVKYNGKTTNATVLSDGKTIKFGFAAIVDDKAVVTITDSDALTLKIEKTIDVPDTMVAYTGFDKGGYMQDYLYNNIWNTPFVTEEYYSPDKAAKIVITDQYGYAFGLTEWADSKVDFGPKTTSEGEGMNTKRKIESGKWYKVSYWAKAAVAGEKPQLGIAKRNASGKNVGVDIFELTDELTKYTVLFKSESDQLPFFYREEMNYEIILDDVLIEQIEAPYDYIYDLNAYKVTKGATVKATLSNEKLDTPMNCVAVIALYKDGTLKEMYSKNVTDLAIGSTVATDSITVPNDIDDGEYTVKAFLWGADMSPICEAKSISEPIE